MTLGIALIWALPRVHPNLHPTAWAKMTLSSAQNIFYKHKILQFIVSGRWGVGERGRDLLHRYEQKRCGVCTCY